MDIAVTGINAGRVRMAVAAHNTANLNTEGYKAYRVDTAELPNRRGTRARVSRTDNPPELVTEMVNMKIAERSIEANIAVLQTESQMMGELINMFA